MQASFVLHLDHEAKRQEHTQLTN